MADIDSEGSIDKININDMIVKDEPKCTDYVAVNMINDDKIAKQKIQFLQSNIIMSKKYLIDDLEKPWNYRIMTQLQIIGEKALGYKWMHNKDLEYYTVLLKYMTIAEIIFTTLHAASLKLQ